MNESKTFTNDWVVITSEGWVYGPFASHNEANLWRVQPHTCDLDDDCTCKVQRVRKPD